MKRVINSVTKFAIDLLVKTIALTVELHLSVTRIIKNSARKPILQIENASQAKSLGDEPGSVASGPDSHLTKIECDPGACSSIEDFNTRTRSE